MRRIRGLTDDGVTCARPPTEPDLRISHIQPFRQIHNLSSDGRFGFGDNVFPSFMSSIVSIPLPVATAIDDSLHYFPQARIASVRIEQQAAQP